jgi:hypothetical protein
MWANEQDSKARLSAVGFVAYDRNDVQEFIGRLGYNPMFYDAWNVRTNARCDALCMHVTPRHPKTCDDNGVLVRIDTRGEIRIIDTLPGKIVWCDDDGCIVAFSDSPVHGHMGDQCERGSHEKHDVFVKGEVVSLDAEHNTHAMFDMTDDARFCIVREDKQGERTTKISLADRPLQWLLTLRTEESVAPSVLSVNGKLHVISSASNSSAQSEYVYRRYSVSTEGLSLEDTRSIRFRARPLMEEIYISGMDKNGEIVVSDSLVGEPFLAQSRWQFYTLAEGKVTHQVPRYSNAAEIYCLPHDVLRVSGGE